MIVLICLCAAGDVPTDAAFPLLDDGVAVRTLAVGDRIAALVADVPEAMFLGAAAEQRLQDAEWLRDRAIAHEAIVRAASACGPVLPVPFGTVFVGEASLSERLLASSEAVCSFFDAVRGCDEYSVRAVVDMSRAAEQAATKRGATAAMSPGQQYLQRARLKRSGDGELAEYLEELTERIEGCIEPLCQDLVRRDVVDRGDEGSRIVLHAAVLTSDLDRLSAGLEQIADEVTAGAGGVDFEVTGPWPPYSFTPRLDDSTPDPAHASMQEVTN